MSGRLQVAGPREMPSVQLPSAARAAGADAAGNFRANSEQAYGSTEEALLSKTHAGGCI